MKFLSMLCVLVLLDSCGTVSRTQSKGAGGPDTPSAPTITATYKGLGASTPTCIDRDGDEYGVGATCLGPDADDEDTAVHTAAEAIGKWGTIAAFFQHLGYSATGKIRYISTTGSDTGTCTLTDACASFDYVKGLGLAADDIVLWRAGTYTEAINSNYDSFNGTSGHPIVLMSYPGEKATIDASSSIQFCRTSSTHDIVIDGLVADNSAHSGGYGISGCYWTRVAVKNVEAKNHTDAIFVMEDNHDVTIQYCAAHDTYYTGHPIYIGARELPNTNITVANSLIYNGDSSGLQHNGRVTNLVFEGNIVYGNFGAGIALLRGTSNSFVRNNLTFNNQEEFNILNYDSGASYTCPPYCNYDQTGNIIENNTFYNGGYQRDGTGSANTAVFVTNTTAGSVGDLGHNTFRNNIFVSPGTGGHYPPVIYATNAVDYLLTSKFDHNIFWTLDGSTGVISKGNAGSGGWGYAAYDCATAASLTTLTTCISSNPQFVVSDASWYASPQHYNFDLLSGSPAIDAGSPTGAPAGDIRGRARVSAPDIGAYESSAPK